MINASELKSIISKGKANFIAETARVFGKVHLGDEVSIWYGAVLRGDADHIHIGNRSNVQDNATIHVDPGFGVNIGESCIIGHGAVVHGATLHNNVLVGIHATILNGAVIGEYSIIGAGTVVTEGAVIPPYSLVLGIPGKVVKTISDAQKEKIIKNADAYVALSKIYLEAK